MRDFLVNLFRDDTFGPIIRLYNIWHILYLLIAIALVVFASVKLYKKDDSKKNKVLNILAIVIISLYFGDFFIHPLMNNEDSLIVDKLPFHLCTQASILICITRIFKDKMQRLYQVVPILGTIGAMYYIFVPTGVNGDRLLCYRTLQTMIYHGLLFGYGILSIVFNDVKIDFKNIYTASILVVIQIIISLFANNIYSSPDHHYDWYFTTGSLFGFSPYIMPFLVFIAFVGTFAIIYGIVYLIRKKLSVNNL